MSRALTPKRLALSRANCVSSSPRSSGKLSMMTGDPEVSMVWILIVLFLRWCWDCPEQVDLAAGDGVTLDLGQRAGRDGAAATPLPSGHGDPARAGDAAQRAAERRGLRAGASRDDDDLVAAEDVLGGEDRDTALDL